MKIRFKEGELIKLKYLADVYTNCDTFPEYSGQYKYFGETVTILYSKESKDGLLYYIKEDKGEHGYNESWIKS